MKTILFIALSLIWGLTSCQSPADKVEALTRTKVIDSLKQIYEPMLQGYIEKLTYQGEEVERSKEINPKDVDSETPAEKEAFKDNMKKAKVTEPHSLTEQFMYKDHMYEVHTGPKGGRFILTSTGVKKYLPKK